MGSAGAGKVGHRLRERRSHLRRDRRPALGHGRRRPGLGSALASRASLPARFHRPAPAGLLTNMQEPLGTVLDLQRRVVDVEPLLEQVRQLKTGAVAVGLLPHQDMG